MKNNILIDHTSNKFHKIIELPEELKYHPIKETRTESPSSIASFVECPLKWYLERHSPLKPSRTTNFYSSCGTFVHRILEVFYEEPRKERTKEKITVILNESWEEINSGESTGLVSSSQIKDFFELFSTENNKESLKRRYYKRAELSLNRIFLVEKPEEIEVLQNEVKFEKEIKEKNVLIRGRIDRVTKQNGAIVIEDYKTSKTTMFKNSNSFLDPKIIPMGIYGLLYKEENKQADKATWLYLGDGKKQSFKINSENTGFLKALLNQILNKMEESLKTGSLIASPGDKNCKKGSCFFCPFKDVCPAKTKEFNSLIDLLKEMNKNS